MLNLNQSRHQNSTPGSPSGNTSVTRTWYEEITFSKALELNEKAVHAAEAALAIADKELGLNLELKFFKPTSKGIASMETLLNRLGKAVGTIDLLERATVFEEMPGIKGHFRWLSDTILLSIEQSPEEIVKTVAHESRHAYQSKWWKMPTTGQEKVLYEQDAEVFENQFFSKYASIILV